MGRLNDKNKIAIVIYDDTGGKDSVVLYDDAYGAILVEIKHGPVYNDAFDPTGREIVVGGTGEESEAAMGKRKRLLSMMLDLLLFFTSLSIGSQHGP